MSRRPLGPTGGKGARLWCLDAIAAGAGKPRQKPERAACEPDQLEMGDLENAILRSLRRLSRHLGGSLLFRVYLLWRDAIFGEIGIWLRCFAVYASQECIRVLSFRLLAWGRDERRPPPQILSFLPPCLHSKSMTSGVSGSGGDQPIGVELRTDRSLSPFCCSGQSATKEGCWGLIPINLPGAEARQDCHYAVPPPVEYFGIIRAANTPGVAGVWGVKGST